MPTITPRKNKNGEITSYTIRVYHGYDGAGKRLKPYSMSWKPAQGMTQKQIEKELNRQAVQFEEQCRIGYALDNKQTFAEYAEYVVSLKERSGVKHSAIYWYREQLKRINAGIGHLKLNEIRPQHLNAFYAQLSSKGLRGNGSKAVCKIDLPLYLKNNGISKTDLQTASGVSEHTLIKCYHSE